MTFVLAGCDILNTELIHKIDTTRIENLEVAVTMNDGEVICVMGSQAIDLVMATKPSALEGRHLRWVRRAWLVHNLIGHPLMQLLALVNRHDLGLRIHDATIPRPKTSRRKTKT